MPVVVTHEAPAIIRFTLSGDWPTVHEQRASRRPLLESGQLTRESRVLVDIRAVNELPKFNEVEAALNLAAVDLASLPKYLALIVHAGAHFGVARMVQSMAPAGLAVELFTDEAAARDWLMQQ